LLESANYSDFSILNVIFTKKKPCINSGRKLPLNQAILRGNPYIVRTLLERGDPHPYTVDQMGKSPLHMAAITLNYDAFEEFVEEIGCDPLLPDSDGNTWVHMLALGTISDKEYDFIRNNMLKYNLRLTRNKENRTALNTIKQYSGQALALRGQPNFKRKIWEWFEQRIASDCSFVDSAEAETETQKLIL
jgi:ankyrin repeat protein